MYIISSDEILAFMMYIDNAKNDNVVEVFFEFAYENRHSEKFLAYLEVFFTKIK